MTVRAWPCSRLADSLMEGWLVLCVRCSTRRTGIQRSRAPVATHATTQHAITLVGNHTPDTSTPAPPFRLQGETRTTHYSSPCTRLTTRASCGIKFRMLPWMGNASPAASDTSSCVSGSYLSASLVMGQARSASASSEGGIRGSPCAAEVRRATGVHATQRRALRCTTLAARASMLRCGLGCRGTQQPSSTQSLFPRQ